LAKPERSWRLEKKFNRQERKELRKVREDFENSTLDSHIKYEIKVRNPLLSDAIA
jgi:hypothetical protein